MRERSLRLARSVGGLAGLDRLGGVDMLPVGERHTIHHQVNRLPLPAGGVLSAAKQRRESFLFLRRVGGIGGLCWLS